MSSYVVTGASRGIGLEFVRQLSDHPSNTVIAVVRNKSNIPHLAPLLARANVHAVQADVTSPEQLAEAAVEVGQITGGSLDVLIANAGISEKGAGVTLAQPGLDQRELGKAMVNMFEWNTVSAVWTNNAFLPLLRRGKQKKIIDTSSGLGDVEFTKKTNTSGMAPYSISKAALSFAVLKYAIELQPEGFTVVAISPGLVDTSSTKDTPPPTEEEMKQFAVVAETWAAAYPNWDRKPISVEESVRCQLQTIEAIGPQDNGRFMSHHNDDQWY
ncbi:hypothetical protein BZG36_00753 [Bifiguratus adelaidae]|uniref:NAD(P)-binding protein n=1 Tax=Bifiguratus adelaidae TaxID=1938954 RepID=A0A261Y6Y6_9FUNG|nr:hypothetical protein BZG36_00753 [Bifiguratus adelaidae]